ncbi:MAG: tyrosine-type recombinase/integrase [Rikenellaceae bacterium]
MKEKKFKVLLYLKKGSINKSGLTPIMGRITVGNSMVQFSCKLSCKESLWNPRESRLNGKSKIAVDTNAKLDKLLLAVNDAYDALIGRKQPFVAEDVKNFFQGGLATQMTLLVAFDADTDRLKARVGIDRSHKTIAKYVIARRCLAAFIKKRHKCSDMAFGQLNEQFIRDFQDFAILENGYAIDTVRHFLALLKKVCKIAFRDGYSERLYFAHFKLPQKKESSPRALSLEEFTRLRDLEIAPEKVLHNITRDMFIFSCWTGAAYVDAASITKENLSRDEKGALWLIYNRGKNGALSRVKLLPEAIEIIEKYHDENRASIFPHIKYPTSGVHMRSFRHLIGMQRDLTYHMSRHTFATLITLEQGVPIETVSKMLGHSDISTTQIYARVTPKKLFDDMDIYIEATKDLKLVL